MQRYFYIVIFYSLTMLKPALASSDYLYLAQLAELETNDPAYMITEFEQFDSVALAEDLLQSFQADQGFGPATCHEGVAASDLELELKGFIDRLAGRMIAASEWQKLAGLELDLVGTFRVCRVNYEFYAFIEHWFVFPKSSSKAAFRLAAGYLD